MDEKIVVREHEVKDPARIEALNQLNAATNTLRSLDEPFVVDSIHLLTKKQKNRGRVGFSLAVSTDVENPQGQERVPPPAFVPIAMDKSRAGVVVQSLLEQGALTRKQVDQVFDGIEERRKRGVQWW